MLLLHKFVIEKMLFCMKELPGLMFRQHGVFANLALHINHPSPDSFFSPSLSLSPLLLFLPHFSSNLTTKQRYGAAAGQATDHAVNSAINVGLTAFNVDNLGIKAVVKRTGKQTAKAILDDYNLPEKPVNGKQLEEAEK